MSDPSPACGRTDTHEPHEWVANHSFPGPKVVTCPGTPVTEGGHPCQVCGEPTANAGPLCPACGRILDEYLQEQKEEWWR